MKQIVLFGQAIIDFLCEADSDLIRSFGFQEKEFTLADIASIQKLIRSSNILYSDIGGCVTNTAIGLSKLEQECFMLYPLGSDENGRLYDAKLSEFERINRIPQHVIGDTGIVSTFVEQRDDNKKRTSVYNHGCSNSYDTDFPLDLFHDNVVVYISSFSLLDDNSSKVLRALKYAKSFGATIILDCGGISKLSDSTFRSLLDIYDGMISNSHELEWILKNSNMTLPDLSQNRFLVSKNGAEYTCVYYNGRLIGKILPQRINHVENFIGAGDAFSAGFLKAFANNYSLNDSVHAGNEYAGEIIKKVEFY